MGISTNILFKENLIGKWSGNSINSGIALDRIGTKNSNNTVLFSPLRFDVVPNNSAYNNLSNLSIHAKVNLGQITSIDNNIFTKNPATVSDGGNYADPYQLIKLAVINGYVQFRLSGNTSGTAKTLTSTTLLSINTDYDITCTFNSGVMKIYINGTQDCTQTTDLTTIGSSNNIINIGRWDVNNYSQNSINAIIYNVYYYNITLNTTDISNIISGNAPITGKLIEKKYPYINLISSKIGKAFSFNGISESVDFINSNYLNYSNISIRCLWSSKDNNAGCLWSSISSNSTYEISVFKTDNTRYFVTIRSDNAPVLQVYFITNINIGIIYELIFTIGSSGHSFFVNGIKIINTSYTIGNINTTFDISIISSNLINMTFGKRMSTINIAECFYSNINLDFVELYNRQLSEKEISAIYNQKRR